MDVKLRQDQDVTSFPRVAIIFKVTRMSRICDIPNAVAVSHTELWRPPATKVRFRITNREDLVTLLIVCSFTIHNTTSNLHYHFYIKLTHGHVYYFSYVFKGP